MQLEKRPSDQAEISTRSTEIGVQQSPAPGATRSSLNNISLKTSPGDKIISPRECKSPRTSGKARKKRSPRSWGNASPRDKISPRGVNKTKTTDGPKPRRNKKKRSTRHYTDYPNEKTEAICAKDDQKPMVNEIRALQQSVMGDVNIENLVKTATALVNTVVAEAMTIVRGKADSETNKEEIKKVASTVLKHVFYIVCHKWKLYYSHIPSPNLNLLKDIDYVKIDKDTFPETNNLNEGDNKIIWKNDNAAAKLTVDNCTSPTDDETVKDDLVHHIVGTTVSADHLETMTMNCTPERKLWQGKPVLKKSEPNIYQKEGQSLRLTKSEVMNLPTNNSVEMPHGIEAQKYAEGNTTHSTYRLKETQKEVPMLKVNILTVGNTTNEKGSGELVVASVSKTKAVAFTENEAII